MMERIGDVATVGRTRRGAYHGNGREDHPKVAAATGLQCNCASKPLASDEADSPLSAWMGLLDEPRPGAPRHISDADVSDLSIENNLIDLSRLSDVLQWVSAEYHQIRELVRLNRTQFFAQSGDLRCPLSRSENYLPGRQTHIHQLSNPNLQYVPIDERLVSLGQYHWADKYSTAEKQQFLTGYKRVQEFVRRFVQAGGKVYSGQFHFLVQTESCDGCRRAKPFLRFLGDRIRKLHSLRLFRCVIVDRPSYGSHTVAF